MVVNDSKKTPDINLDIQVEEFPTLKKIIKKPKYNFNFQPLEDF